MIVIRDELAEEEIVTSDALSRRGLLKGLGVGIAASALPPPWFAQALEVGGPARWLPLKELEGIIPRVSPSTDRVAHLLHRTTFGVRPGELERAR